MSTGEPAATTGRRRHPRLAGLRSAGTPTGGVREREGGRGGGMWLGSAKRRRRVKVQRDGGLPCMFECTCPIPSLARPSCTPGRLRAYVLDSHFAARRRRPDSHHGLGTLCSVFVCGDSLPATLADMLLPDTYDGLCSHVRRCPRGSLCSRNSCGDTS